MPAKKTESSDWNFKKIVKTLLPPIENPKNVEKAKDVLRRMIAENLCQSVEKTCSEKGTLFRFRIIDNEDCDKLRRELPKFMGSIPVTKTEEIDNLLSHILKFWFAEKTSRITRDNIEDDIHGNSFNAIWKDPLLIDHIKCYVKDKQNALFEDRIKRFDDFVMSKFSTN